MSRPLDGPDLNPFQSSTALGECPGQPIRVQSKTPKTGLLDQRQRFINGAPSIVELADFSMSERAKDDKKNGFSRVPIGRFAVRLELITRGAS